MKSYKSEVTIVVTTVHCNVNVITIGDILLIND